jgi:hypothetical protein
MPYTDPTIAREYLREWRKNNQEKVKDYNRKWRLNNPERREELNKQSLARCRNQRNEYQRKRHSENPERHREYDKRSYEKQIEKRRAKTARWRIMNPEKLHDYLIKTKESHRPARNAASRKHKARKNGYVDCITYPPPSIDGKCDLCGRVAKLNLDHDHDTGNFRGWLCTSCNMALGKLGDNLEGLMKAVQYLQRRQR